MTPSSPRPAHNAVALCCLSLLVLGVLPATTRAGESQMYLSWGSPYGTPGARDTLVRACGDSTRVDTLCFSIEAGVDYPNLVALTGYVEFHPPRGDTLSRYWNFAPDSSGPGTCRGEFSGTGREDCPFPWSSPGLPVVRFLRRDGKGLLVFLYAVSTQTPVAVRAGDRYCVGRVLLRHRAEIDTGCDQPLQIVWSDAMFGEYPGEERRVISGRKRPVFVRTP